MDDKISSAIFLAKRHLVDNIWRSAQIEGLGTTFPNTEAILAGLPAETTYEEACFLMGMKHGWEYLLSHLCTPNVLSAVMELHEVTCKFLVRSPGVLRYGGVRISGCNYIPSIPKADEVYNDLLCIDKVSDSVQKSLALFCYLSRSQLFWDGNKRIAQLMANKVLIESGVGILSIGVGSNDMKEFFNRLVNYYETDDATQLCKYLRTCIEYVN